MTDPGAPRRNASFPFWALVFLAVLVLQVSVTVALALADHRWFGGHDRLEGYGGVALMPSFVVGVLFATAVCRRLGLLGPRAVEVLRRDPAFGLTPGGEFELRTPRSAFSGWGSVAIGVGVVIAALVVTLPAVPGTQVYGYGTALAFVVLGLLAFRLGRLPGVRFVARVDAAGVTGYDGLRRRTVPWPDLAECEVVTNPAPGGGEPSRVYTLRGAGGGRLMTLTLLTAEAADRARFDRAVRQAFGAAD